MKSTGQSALPPTSLIICSRNRSGMLAETVRSVLAGREVPTELIVVDQSDVPTDGLASAGGSSGCEVRYTWSPVHGLSHANNLGVRLARHEVLVFTHDDVHADEFWFGTLVRSLLVAGPRSVVTGRVPPGPPEVPGGFQQTLRTSQTPTVWQGRTRERPLLVLNMALLRGTYAEVGGFDERLGPGTPFPGAEDVDLGFRLLEAGYRIIYVPDAVIYHRAWRKPSSYLSIRWAYGLALGGFYAKHLSVRDRWMAHSMLAVLRSRMSRGVRALAGRPRAAMGDFLSVAGIVAGTGLWWLTQARRPRAPASGDLRPARAPRED
jgi:GT2 family glycosyltransferase